MPAPTVLDLLSDLPQPPDRLAQQLGQPEALTQQQLDTLQQEGLVEGSENGYALPAGTPAPKLVPVRGKLGQTMRYVAHTESTQQEVQRLGRWLEERGQPSHGAVVVAHLQSQGRGRRGRSWLSQAGNLLFSVLLSEDGNGEPLNAQSLPMLPLTCGVALQAACGVGGLKWPNDLLTPDRRKLAGILLEAEWQGQSVRQVVLGVGLNVSSAPPQAAALQELSDLSRAEVLARFLEQLEYWLAQSPAQVLDAWRTVNLTLGKEVEVQTAAGQLRGVALDINDAGELLIQSAQGQQTISSGDLALVGTLTPLPALQPHNAALQFRRAQPTDAPQAAPLILAANGTLAHHLTGTQTDAEALQALETLFQQPGHRLSHTQTWLALRGGQCVGLAVAYPGEEAHTLDELLRQRLAELGLPNEIVSEGQNGELYLDTLATRPDQRGQGVGTQLLRHMQEQAAALGRPLGLLVERGNPAQRLYSHLGFVEQDEIELSGHHYLRMVWQN